MKKIITGSESVQRIIVAEFPKSGGSWFVTMIGNALAIPVRDIYVKDENYSQAFDIRKHPWYEGNSTFGLTDKCVIKSHELPESKLHNMDAKFIHLLRDGRDVVVSKYFFEKDFMVNNGLIDEFTMSFYDFVDKTSREWAEYIIAWEPYDVVTCRYEDLLKNPIYELKKTIKYLNLSATDEEINTAINANTKDKFKKTLDKAFKYNTFVRKGTVGDWKNYFTEKEKMIFKQNAGDLLIRLGYERDSTW